MSDQPTPTVLDRILRRYTDQLSEVTDEEFKDILAQMAESPPPPTTGTFRREEIYE